MNSSLSEKLARLKQAQDEAYAASPNLEQVEAKVWQRIEACKVQKPLFLAWVLYPHLFQNYVKPVVIASIMGFGLGIITPALLLPQSPNFAQEVLHFKVFNPRLTPIHFLIGSK